MTHHDRDEGANNRQRCGLSKNQLGQHDTEDRLQGLHSVGQADGDSINGQIGGHMSNGMHGGWPSDLAELLLGHTLQARWRHRVAEVLPCVLSSTVRVSASCYAFCSSVKA